MVRRAAANHIGAFTKELEMEYVQNELKPIYKTLGKDDQDSVRLLVCRSIVALTKKVNAEEQENEDLVIKWFL